MVDRYSRQAIVIGNDGQDKLAAGSVVIIGCGALGSVIATTLVRAGVGKVRIIDRDFIEPHNLQRQVLFTEKDIESRLPKAVAAERHLKKVNSSVDIEGIVADVNYATIEQLVIGADIVMDGLDNFETRLLINDVSQKLGIPWVYGGAIATFGMTMTIIPHSPPCFRCFTPEVAQRGVIDTCDTAGVIGPAPFIIGSLQAAEAMKLLLGSTDSNRDIISIDVWARSFDRLKIPGREDCPACNGTYEFLDGKFGRKTTVLCGQNAVQVSAPGRTGLSFPELAARLGPVGNVDFNKFMFHFTTGPHEMIIFPDGRAIVRNTTDESLARGLYSKYIGS
ncbi:MAG: ThiF family adenylyltransferase [bacterium]|nr:ThiF family adenylyltransferase [bacterium]